MYKAEILADSVSPDGVRLTTIETIYPRFIHPEVLRHRNISHSVASSRAVPTEKNIERVRTAPFIPDTFNARVKGMGVGDPLVDEEAAEAKRMWLLAAGDAAQWADGLNRMEIDKSRANRLMEPFIWVHDIMTATDWSSFFGLRCPPGNEPDINFPAQLEFQQLAIMMRDAMRESTPQQLDYGWWHWPKITQEEFGRICEARKEGNEEKIGVLTYAYGLVSSRRCAAISFEKVNVEEEWEVSIDKANTLFESQHYSPGEHSATPLSNEIVLNNPEKIRVVLSDITADQAMPSPDKLWCGNFKGWYQFRKGFDNENVYDDPQGEWPS